MREDFPFQRREKRFGDGIVETRPHPAHRLADPQLAAQCDERVCGIGRSAVGVEDDPLTRAERLNVFFVLGVSQVVQVLTVAVLTAIIYFWA